MSKLSHVDKTDVAKKTVYDKLDAKVNNIDTSNFVLKTKYQTAKTELEKKIPDLTDFVKKTKLTEKENKIPDVSSLATKTALIVVENKIPSVSSLVRKQLMTQKTVRLKKNLLIIIMANNYHGKYIATPECNTLAASAFNARLAQANLITKTDFDDKLSSLNRKITHSFLQDWNPPFSEETPPPPLSGYPPLSEADLESYPPLSENHPNWCM